MQPTITERAYSDLPVPYLIQQRQLAFAARVGLSAHTDADGAHSHA